jgi:DNA polymerase-3 subunit delta
MASASGDPLEPLRGPELGPLYFVYGKERFLVDRAVDLIRERVLDPRTRDFNYELFYGKEASVERIISAARTLPMMARRRLVVVRDADAMKSEELAQLIPYVSAPAKESCLVLQAEKADQRWKLVTAWKKHGVLVRLDPLYERQLPAFVREEARAKALKLAPGAAELICDEVGAELGQLADVVERLAIFVADRPAVDRLITAEDVERLVATTRQRNVFELCNAVGEGNRARALSALASMISQKESGVRIVSMLARHVRQLWAVRGMLGARSSKFDIAGALGIPPFFVDGLMDQARRVPEARLPKMHEALYRADRELKSSRLPDDRILERLILELTHKGADASGGRPRATR